MNPTDKACSSFFHPAWPVKRIFASRGRHSFHMAGWIQKIDFDTNHTIMHIEATGRPRPESPWAFSSPMVSLTHSLHTQRKKACRAAPPQPRSPRSRAVLCCWAPNHHSHEGGAVEAAAGGGRAAGNRGNTATDRHHAHALQSESAGRSHAGARAVLRSACCVSPSPLSPSSQRGAATA